MAVQPIVKLGLHHQFTSYLSKVKEKDDLQYLKQSLEQYLADVNKKIA